MNSSCETILFHTRCDMVIMSQVLHDLLVAPPFFFAIWCFCFLQGWSHSFLSHMATERPQKHPQVPPLSAYPRNEWFAAWTDFIRGCGTPTLQIDMFPAFSLEAFGTEKSNNMSEPRNIQPFVSKCLWGRFLFRPFQCYFFNWLFNWLQVLEHQVLPFFGGSLFVGRISCMARLNLQLTELASNTRALELNTCLGTLEEYGVRVYRMGEKMEKLKGTRNTQHIQHIPSLSWKLHCFHGSLFGVVSSRVCLLSNESGRMRVCLCRSLGCTGLELFFKCFFFTD